MRNPSNQSVTWTGAGAAGRARAGAVLAAAFALVATLGAAADAEATTLEQVTSFGTNPGNLIMRRYVPAGLVDAPLVVVLHGCTQSASAYLAGSGWGTLADTHRFALVFAEQQSANNSSKCFNWFESGDITRDQGEARSIISMVDHMVANVDINPDRIFVTGLSAGGAMTAVMLALYPDVFAGGAIMAGIPYKCAIGSSAAFSCMNPGVNKTPAEWGNLVRNAFSFTGPRPVVSIWHGTSDTTVRPMNMDELVEQWTDVHGIDRTVDATATVGNGTRREYKDGAGTVLVESWTLTGMGHATANDPGTATGQCGAAGSFFSDQNVCSSFQAGVRWGIIAGGGEPPPPPPPGGHVCQTVTTNNFNHVSAGRAYQNLGNTFAVGSNDPMGLYNTFVTTTLSETAAGFWRVGNCP
ncbi:MAG TPA: PHB depolymerase family esterase [Haliangium sp.]|nr:PHB depolymerase family esterase [Haliangium sp.]